MNTSAQRGVAIITVLLIVAIATSVAAYMAQQQNLWLRQVQAQFDRSQARRLGIAGIDWARAVLADDARTNNIDHETEMWTLRLPAMPVENGEVLGVIEDRQGLFNLNNLVRNRVSSAPDVAQFQRLLALLDLPAELANALADWMDGDNSVQQPGGAEDEYYLSLPNPYRSASRNLIELGELSKVKGFDAKTIERLRPFVTVLPLATTVNVNFASAEILSALISHLNLSEARQLVQQRRGKPFQNIDEFKQKLPTGVAQNLDTNFTVSSQFFWVTGRAKVANSQVITQALLQRNGGWPQIIWQSVQ